jgi:hypothetical protein
VVALCSEFAKLDWPYFPYVYCPISDLIHDERNLPVLIKRCCLAAKRQGVPWHVLIQFNLEVLQQPNYTLAWGVCVHWFDTVGEYVQKPVVAALELRTGALWLFQE